jgi:hypothetical protein
MIPLLKDQGVELVPQGSRLTLMSMGNVFTTLVTRGL